MRTRIQKPSVQPLIPDTSIPQVYVTQQQHPHSSVFLDFKSKKIYTESSKGKQRPCRAQAVELSRDAMCPTQYWEQDIGVKGQFSQGTAGSGVCVHIL